MDFKKLLKPSKWKVTAFIVILLIFGLPATYVTCSTYVLTPGQSPPPCVSYMAVANLLTYFTMIGGTDVSNSFTFNPVLVVTYVVILYLVLSLLFYANRKK